MARIDVDYPAGGGGGGGDIGPELESIAALTPANDDIMQRKAGAWANRTLAQVKADLGVTNYTDEQIDDIAFSVGDKQDADADLQNIANLTPADGDVLRRQAGAWINQTIAQLKTALGLVKNDVGLSNVDNTSDAAKPVSTATTTALALKQDADTDLSVIAALAPANDDIMQRKAGAWANRTLAQVRADLNTGAQAEGNSSASGSNSHAEGTGTATGIASHAEGNNSLAQASYSHAEGTSTQVTGTATAGHAEGGATMADAPYAHAEGYGTYALGQYAHSGGFQSRAFRQGQRARASGQFAVAGDAQHNEFTARRSTTNATPVTLTFDGGSSVTLTGSTINVLTIPASKAHTFRVAVIARRTDVAGEAAGWIFEGLVARDSSGNARIVGTPTATAWGDSGAALWDVALSIDTTDATDNYLKITATGEAAKTIRWVATIDTTEVG